MMQIKSKAILFMILSSLSFALMAACVKLLSETHLIQKVFFRNLIGMMIILFFAIMRKKPLLGDMSSRPFLIARAMFGLAGVTLYFYATSNLMLADASMLNRLSPFFVAVLAVIFLKENLSKMQIGALVLAFISALMIIKPRFDLSILPALSGFISAFCAGSAYTLVRYLHNKEHPLTIVFFFTAFSSLIYLPIMFFIFKMPTPIEWIYLIGMGIFSASGQIFLTYGYRLWKASEISIYSYTHILFAAILGFILWGSIPDMLSLLGGILMVIAGYISYKGIDMKTKHA